ncbi:GTPase ObgE/CgtA [archaeon BMS3Bbin15]|nr:GTPase ObgE/CgtA [archaeon BMS3Bbin15]
MNFKKIPRIMTSQELIDMAFSRSIKETKKKLSYLKGNRLNNARKIEQKKLEIASKESRQYLDTILKKTPSFTSLPDFYYELISLTIDIDKTRKALGALKWASERIGSLEGYYRGKIKASQTKEEFKKKRREFFGRLASVLRQIDGELEYLQVMKGKLKNLPIFKEEFTVVIAGAPNAGKSSLLKAITGASPKIEGYPFTTQKLLLGYMLDGVREYQIVDTPGLLDRNIEEMNPVERQAILALGNLADIIIFVYDPSETCGFSKSSQFDILENIQKNFNSNVLVMLSKADLLEKDEINEIVKFFHDKIYICSVKDNYGIDKIKEYIITEAKRII